MNKELKVILKEAVMAYFKVLCELWILELRQVSILCQGSRSSGTGSS